MNKPTQAEIAIAMTSEHPPTNTRLLEKWKEDSKDADLQVLIACWVGHLEGQNSQFDFFDEHQKVHEKLKTGFYEEK